MSLSDASRRRLALRAALAEAERRGLAIPAIPRSIETDAPELVVTVDEVFSILNEIVEMMSPHVSAELVDEITTHALKQIATLTER